MDKLNFVRDFIVFNSNPLFVFLPKELNGAGRDLRLRLEYIDSVKLSIISPIGTRVKSLVGYYCLNCYHLLNSCLTATASRVRKANYKVTRTLELEGKKIQFHCDHKIKKHTK